MGKAEKGTPKDIANRMKAKGLQKLRWYCQMCQKQCRDENGFKCHTTSEGHQRQLLLFAEDPDKYLDSFSEEFLDGYISLLKRRFGTKRVHANNVYQEYIHDRDHVHMNATKWETLTEFVKWLGREGFCIVDETEKGWFVTYIDRDPETLLKQDLKQKREKHEKDEEERFQEFINHQIERGKAKNNSVETDFSELKRDTEESITLDLKLKPSLDHQKKEAVPNPLKLKSLSTTHLAKTKKDTITKKRSVLEEVIEEDKQRKKRFTEKEIQLQKESCIRNEESWLRENIYVKIITKDLGSKFYKAKGYIKKVVSDYCAIVKLIDCGTKLKLDQVHLETVIPNLEREVLILSGKYKGQLAILKSLHVEKFSACLDIIYGKDKGKKVENIPYEHFSKKYKPT